MKRILASKNMNREILTIGLSPQLNDPFKRSFKLDKLCLVACEDMGEAIRLLSKAVFVLIILNATDWKTEETEEAVEKIRRATPAPLLVLSTAEAAGPAMEVGADVCVPIFADIHAVFSQAMALIRRNEIFCRFDEIQPDAVALYRGDLIVDSARHRVIQAGKEINLKPREFRLLAYFARNPGIVLSPDQISHAVWLYDMWEGRDVTQVISELRRKLQDSRNNPKYIQTVHGVGYRFLPDK